MSKFLGQNLFLFAFVLLHIYIYIILIFFTNHQLPTNFSTPIYVLLLWFPSSYFPSQHHQLFLYSSSLHLCFILPTRHHQYQHLHQNHFVPCPRNTLPHSNNHTGHMLLSAVLCGHCPGLSTGSSNQHKTKFQNGGRLSNDWVEGHNPTITWPPVWRVQEEKEKTEREGIATRI